VPIYEIGLNDLIRRNVDRGRLHFSDNLAEAVEECSVVFIAVGTPPRDDGWTDLSAFHQVCRGIGAAMNGYKVVVIKSTVPVGTARKAAQLIRENQNRPLDFDVVSNPEFLREGSAVEDFMRPDRVVIGTDSRKAIKVMKEMYRPLELIDTPILVTTNETAEMMRTSVSGWAPMWRRWRRGLAWTAVSGRAFSPRDRDTVGAVSPKTCRH
jgi:UDPglucose 6-dehydrogenase